MSAWLQKQKKGDLQDLAKKSGLPDGDDLLKEELVDGLNAHLRKPANETKFGGDPAFAEFYSRVSPSKKSTTVPLKDDEKAPRKRKQSIKVKEELDTLVDTVTKESKALAVRTPKAVQKVASRLPASPAVVDAFNRQTTAIGRRVSSAIEKSGLDDSLEWVRDFLGSVEGVTLCSTLLEALSLRRATFPWSRLLDVKYTKQGDYLTVYYPNFYMLTQPKFWSMTLLWTTTSLIVPAVASYFVNLTRPKHHGVTTRRQSKSQYPFDPMTFNITKALLAWLVYSQFFNFFGVFSALTIAETNLTILGGYQGMLIGSGIGILVTLYDAVLKK